MCLSVAFSFRVDVAISGLNIGSCWVPRGFSPVTLTKELCFHGIRIVVMETQENVCRFVPHLPVVVCGGSPFISGSLTAACQNACAALVIGAAQK